MLCCFSSSVNFNRFSLTSGDGMRYFRARKTDAVTGMLVLKKSLEGSQSTTVDFEWRELTSEKPRHLVEKYVTRIIVFTSVYDFWRKMLRLKKRWKRQSALNQWNLMSNENLQRLLYRRLHSEYKTTGSREVMRTGNPPATEDVFWMWRLWEQIDILSVVRTY